MRSGPTLAALRARVHKERHHEIGNWLARRVGRPSAVYGTWVAVRLGLSAHQVTSLALLASVAGAVAIGTGTRPGFVLGVLFLHVAFWLDHVDGQVARWRGTESLSGVYLDYLMHHVAGMTLGFALGFGLNVRGGSAWWTLAGFAIAAGWTLLNLHNDCRYKAHFQRLKRETRRFRVDGGAGGRPAAAPGWPRRGWGIVTWPALKLCEPHVVLLVLTGLAGLACVGERPGRFALGAFVAVQAVLAPVLALGRIARAVRGGVVDREFGAWFQAEDAS